MQYSAFITFNDDKPIEVFSESATYFAKLIFSRVRYSIQRKSFSSMMIKISKK